MMDWHKTLAEVDATQVRDALQHAQVPALLAALSHLTGDRQHCDQVRPCYDLFGEENDGLSEPEREQARALALPILLDYCQRGCPVLPELSETHVIANMHYITGEQIPDAQLTFLREELNLNGEDQRQVTIDTRSMADDFRVLIIGAGMSGLLAAIRLQQQGIPFLILERNPEAGGTWYENTYPGCQVDSANHLYNYIFEPNHQWPRHFSGSEELKAYFDRLIDKYSLDQFIRVNSSVNSASYDAVTGGWQLQVECNGVVEELQASAVISAVGQLNIPSFPDLPGLNEFAGTAFHSARWEHQHDLNDKRVIVIGTGCSAVQFVPEIAPECEDLKVFQRSAPWLMPVEEYHQQMTEQELWLLREIPFYARWYRFFIFRTRAADGYLPMLYAEPGWQGPPGTIGTANEMLRAGLVESLAEQAGADTELLAKLIPDYPPGGKRPVLDDGSWVKALQRDNVELLDDPIARIVPEGVVTEAGRLHRADVIIYGTGFQADQLLVPMQINGRNGKELVADWGGDPRAYLGVVMPDFPNFYCLYGPNTNIVVGSSIVFFVECQMRYIAGCLKLQLEQGVAQLECRPQVLDDYIVRIDALNAQRAWGAPGVSSWYQNSAGRVTQNWPGTHWEYWLETRAPQTADFLVD